MNEISIAIRTPQGLALVVGCSHPGENPRGGNQDRPAHLQRLRRIPPGGRVGRGSEQYRHALPRQMKVRAGCGRALHRRFRVFGVQPGIRGEIRLRVGGDGDCVAAVGNAETRYPLGRLDAGAGRHPQIKSHAVLFTRALAYHVSVGPRVTTTGAKNVSTILATNLSTNFCQLITS